jgi:hypothetical protein
MKSPFEPGEAPVWVTVGVFDHALDAGAARLRLEADGIPTFLDGERMGDHHAVAAGGVRLQVPRRFAHDAREVLSSPGAVLGDDDGCDDDDEDADLEHVPVMTQVVWWGALVLMGALLVIVIAKLLGVGG